MENKIYYIENTVDEYHTQINGYFPTLDEAKEKLNDCCDWYRPKGTGRIYMVAFGLYPNPELVYEKY